MKFPANMGVVKSSPVKIGRMDGCIRSEPPEKRDPTLSRFARSVSEIKGAVLRESECGLHK
jgi:hypothetical protein